MGLHGEADVSELMCGDITDCHSTVAAARNSNKWNRTLHAPPRWVTDLSCYITLYTPYQLILPISGPPIIIGSCHGPLLGSLFSGIFSQCWESASKKMLFKRIKQLFIVYCLMHTKDYWNVPSSKAKHLCVFHFWQSTQRALDGQAGIRQEGK